MNFDIPPSWKKALQNNSTGSIKDKLRKPHFIDLMQKVEHEYSRNPQQIFPYQENIFKALEETSFDNVKVVILGQDPYHGTDSDGNPQATGLAFSVPIGMRLPPSLQNIFKEISSDLGGGLEKPCMDTVSNNVTRATNGDLTRWAKQGVLLLNSTLTVVHTKPGSHHKLGWEQFTDTLIQALSDQKDGLVFILWGNHAREKARRIHIDRQKHLVLESAHPSPLSAHRGFFGCKHFSKTNRYLESKGLSQIDWT
jgi:uracil-DNA glycosylase